MRKISILILLFCLLIGGPSWASPGDTMSIEKVEQELIDLYRDFWSPENDSYEHHNNKVPSFRKKLEDILLQTNSFNYPFTKLSKNIKVRVSADKRLRIFSWDDNTNTQWRKIGSIAQYLDDYGQVRTQWLSVGDEQITGEFTDVWVYGIHELSNGKQKRYMTIGEGTHGDGSHHLSIQMLYISGKDLLRCQNCFDNAANTLVIQAVVIDHFNLMYDETLQELSYSTFERDEASGLYIKTGERTKLRYNGAQFKMSERIKRN